ncbi:MAG: transposase [Synergistaceae bacterium]|nr:transposase [Synergistaceae bacterium]
MKTHTQDTRKGYWDKRCEVLSSFLWLPAKRVLDDMPQSAANLESSHLLNDTWFDSQTYSLPYSSHHNNGIHAPKSEALRSRKIRIYPDAKQREILRHWMRTARYVYNEAAEYISQGNKADWLAIKSWLIKDLPSWTESTPYQVKAIAVRDACINSKNAAKTEGTAIFRARHSAKQTIFVPKASATKRGVYTRFLGRMDFAEDMPEPEGDCRVIYDCGRWFVSVPVKVQRLSEHYGRTVSLDPGIRSFLTFYSLDSCGKLGEGAFSRIYSLCSYLDGLEARMSQTNHRQRYRMKKAADRLRWRIRNLVEEMQHKTALFLVRNFDVIALPELRADFADGMKSASLREILGSAHSGFGEYLRAKAEEYGTKIIPQDEEWTSQVCSWSGEVREPGKFISDGRETLDRDYNGARGIFLRALRESAITPPV